MVGEAVVHSRYGRGVVTAFEPPRIDIQFESGEQRRFTWPASAERFLAFESEDARRRAQEDVAAAQRTAQQLAAEEAEARRVREEQRAELYREMVRQRRSAAAQKAAASRARAKKAI